jgi:dienelactone hydrolase
VKRLPLALLAVGLLAGTLTACLPDPPPPPPPVSQLDSSHQYGVGIHGIELDDWTRGIAPYGDFPGADVRTIPTTVFYPVWEVPHSGFWTDHVPYFAGGPYPMVVFLSGFGVDWHFYAPLLERIASAGYVVVAPTYPLLSGWPAGPTDTVEWDEHFTDTSFVISAMIERNAWDPLTAGLVDTSRVAVAGHSDGALLAFGAGEQAWRIDARVRSVVSYGGDLGSDGIYLANGRPFLHYLSELDEYDPYDRAISYDRAYLQPPHWVISSWGANHTGPYTDPGDPHFALVAKTTVDFLDGTLKGHPESIFYMALEALGRPDIVGFE